MYTTTKIVKTNMIKKTFEKSEKAMINDLNSVEEFSNHLFGYFRGFLECNRIWLKFTDDQYNKLKKHIYDTFDPKNFNWLGKRKKDTLIKPKTK